MCFSRIKRQCRCPVMSSTSKMVFFWGVFSCPPGDSVTSLSLSVGLTDMICVQNFILPDFQAENFAAQS